LSTDSGARAVEFRLVVFRPFRGEVMNARIRSSSAAGIYRLCSHSFPIVDRVDFFLTLEPVKVDFFDDIFIPYDMLPEGCE